MLDREGVAPEDMLLAGDPDTVRAGLEEYAAAGVDERDERARSQGVDRCGVRPRRRHGSRGLMPRTDGQRLGNSQPLGGNEMPRFAGITTFMRLPNRSEPADLDVAVFGVPFDLGTSNRPGARFGPRGSGRSR